MSRISAVLGPTNTGKTTLAIERMLAYRSGVIGLPLRLLAREVYDRIKEARGPSVVALVTGEERIVPDRVQYWVCTTEAMPMGIGPDFLAVDEIQLCADPERGHVFTDRLLNARGRQETMFLGAETMRPAIAALIPDAEFIHRERLSQLAYTGSKKISRMQPRSALVSFSLDSLYGVAELLRRQKGGAAVVMGALSPRTRNAQVEMYQNGDVDFLVATDAIGMGLNLDIHHIAFSSLTKFDGRRMRPLEPTELGQIAGRAGRGQRSGTFGVTGEAPALDDDVARAITEHSFRPVRKLFWRNSDLRFGSADALIRSLEERTTHDWLNRVRESDDLAALKSLAADPVIAARASDGRAVRLLWDVCRIPDFRDLGAGEHAALLAQLFPFLHDHGEIPEDWLARQIRRLDRPQGDIDTLSRRLAHIRTWTYVAQRRDWTRDENHWRELTRTVEDRLSDALHGALTQRFVDRRTSVLLRRLKQKESLVAEVNEQGDVTIEGQRIGRLEGFRFRMDKPETDSEAKAMRAASVQALAPQFHLRADRFYNAPDTELDFTEQGGLMWGEHAIGKLARGDDALKPRIEAFVDDEAGADVAEKVQRRLQHFVERKIAAGFEPLLAMSGDETLTGLPRGFAFRMRESFGIVPRGEVADDVKALDQDARKLLRKHGVRFGQFTVFMPLLLKPAPTRLRLVLWALWNNLDEFPEAPPPGLVTVPSDKPAAPGSWAMAGYRASGDRAIRIDMLERLADMLRDQDSRGGFEATADMLSITGLSHEQFASLMEGLGYRAEKGERAKPAKPAAEQPAPDAQPAPVAEDTAPTPDDAAPVAEAPDAPKAEAAPAEPEPAAQPEGESDAAQDVADQVSESTDPSADAPETETFWTFTWAGRGRGQRDARRGGQRGGAPAGKAGGKPGGKPQGKGRGKPGGKPRGKPGQGQKAQSFSSGPNRKDRKIDPDNPFAAALAGLKSK